MKAIYPIFNFNKNGNGFVIMINNSSENAFKFIRDLKDIIYDILNWDNENKIIPTLRLEKYEGKYYDKLNNISCEIKQKNNILEMKINKYNFSLYYSKEGYFFEPESLGFIVEFRNKKLYLYQKINRNVFLKE